MIDLEPTRKDDPYDFSLEHDGCGVWLLLRWKRFFTTDTGPTPWRRLARFDNLGDAELVLRRMTGEE